MKRKLLSILLCLTLVLGLGPVTRADEGSSFCLFAATAEQTLISPVRIPYSSGQTVQEALDASGYSFERYGAFIQVIEGVEGGYYIYYDGGGYDLNTDAAGITAVIFSENEGAGEAHLSLLRYMADYRERTDNVQNYPDAAAAYAAAEEALRTGDADTAAVCLQSLQAAVAAYEAMQSDPKVTLEINAVQNGETLSAPVVTLTDAFGNVTTFTGTSMEVIAGTYTVSVSDGGRNRSEKTVAVESGMSVDFSLPYGEWFGEIKLLDQNTRLPYAGTSDTASHTLTLQVPDTAGKVSPILNAAQGSGIPGADTQLYGVYTGMDGVYYGNTPKSWDSTSASLSALFGQGMEGRTFTLEARQMAGAETRIQSYTMVIQRIPTLASLTVEDGNTVLPLAFSPLENSYTAAVTSDTVTISAVPFGGDYEVSGTGTFSMDGNTVQTVTVAAGGQSNTYTVNIEKQDSVNVTLSVPAGTAAAVYNSADSEISPEGGVYHLIPGETYYYIATKNMYYHSRASFTAAEGLTVAVAEPETADRMSAFVLYNASSASTRKEYPFDSAFASSGHETGCTVPDTASILYAQATADTGYSVQAIYNRQTLSASTNGTPNTVTINKTVGASTVTSLSGCVAACGYSQNLTVRVSKTDGGVTQYQDYMVLIRKSAHLKSMALSDGTEPLTLLNDAGTAVDFDRNVTAYGVMTDRGVAALTLNAAFMNESDATSVCGGYFALVNGVRYDSLTDIVLPLDEQESTETVTIEVCHADPDAVSTVYTLTVKKTDPVEVAFTTDPADAVVFVKSNATGKRVYGEENVFPLVPGQIYTYTVTRTGYVGRQVTDYTAPASGDTVSVSLTRAAANGSLPSYSAAWGSTRYDEYNNGAVNVKSPAEAENTALYWATKVGEGYSSQACGCPILVNGYLYTYAGDKIYKIDTISGEILATGTMDHPSSFAINAPTYAEGMIFVGESEGTVQAFNAATLESVWIYRDELEGQPNCPIICRDGYIYTGFWSGETAEANYVCLSVTDENSGALKEEKLPTWTFTCKGGFYWAGAYVSEEFLLIGTDDGKIGYSAGYAKLLSMNPKTGEMIDEAVMPYPGDLRSGITFVPDGSGGGRGYFTSKGGYFYRVDVNADGTFVPGSLAGLQLTNYSAASVAMSTSTPTVYNGRAYVGVAGESQFGQYSGHNITVIDLNSWSIAYTVRTQGYQQVSGLLTTGYEAETGTVNVYFFDNYTPGKMRMITDRPGQTSPSPVTVESYTSGGTTTEYETAYVLFTPYGSQAQYAICSPIADEYGTIYFKNDSAYMMALGSTITELRITTPPAKTAYEAGENFDGAGMTVTAVYSNGAERDVTAYVEWSEEPLTANDTQFEIYFPYVMYHDGEGGAGTKIPEPFAVLDLTIGGSAVMKGDVNEDGEITATDAAILYAVIRNTYTKPLTDKARLAADIDGDGEITATDAARLYAYCRGNAGAIPQT